MHDEYGDYQQARFEVNNSLYRTAVCQSIIKKGDNVSWKFQINSKATSIGIIDNDVATTNIGSIMDFTISKGGIGIYLDDMRLYLGRSTGSKTFVYGAHFKVKENDVITMELDLTQEKGILRFTFQADLKSVQLDENISNILYDKLM